MRYQHYKHKSVHFLDPITDAVVSLEPLTPPSTPSPPQSTYESLSASLIELQPALPSDRKTVVSIHGALSYGNNLCFNAALPIQCIGISPPTFQIVARSDLSQFTSSFHDHNLDFLVEPATSPPLPSLILTSGPSLPWDIEVCPSPPIQFVTVYDVLQALNTNLRTVVLNIEISLFVSEKTFDSIVEAFEERVNSILDVHEREEQRAKFVRRIDCLMGRTRFLGLQWVGLEHFDMFTIGWGWP